MDSHQINEVFSLKDIDWRVYGKFDMIGFDIDDTLVTQSESILRSKNYNARIEALEIIPQKDRARFINDLYNKSTLITVEKDIRIILNTATSCGAQTFGFTARRTGRATSISKETAEQKLSKDLYKSGIYFTLSIPFIPFQELRPSILPKEHLLVPTLRKYVYEDCSMVYDKVLYSNNINKGLVLLRFLCCLPILPRKLVIIDD